MGNTFCTNIAPKNEKKRESQSSFTEIQNILNPLILQLDPALLNNENSLQGKVDLPF